LRTRGAAADHEDPGRRRREAADERTERVVALVPVVRRAALLHVPRVPVLRLAVAQRPPIAAVRASAHLLRPVVVVGRRRRRRHRGARGRPGSVLRAERMGEDQRRAGRGGSSWVGVRRAGGGMEEHRHRCGARASRPPRAWDQPPPPTRRRRRLPS